MHQFFENSSQALELKTKYNNEHFHEMKKMVFGKKKLMVIDDKLSLNVMIFNSRI